MEDCVKLEERSFDSYLSQSEERLLKAAWRRKNKSEVEQPVEYKSKIERLV